MTNLLYYGDNLHILREHVDAASVDLVYLDPPFNSNATYNVLFRAPTGEQSQAQIEAFEDTWHWNEAAEDAYWQVLKGPSTDAARMLEAMRAFLGENDMMAYLAMMAVRLIELHRVLKPTGSLYLHCDPTASHYLKILLDAVFGPRNFRTEIAWKRSSAHSDAKQGRKIHGHIHDTILFYTKRNNWTWNEIYTPYAESYVGRDYRLVDESTGRRFRRGDLTAARPGGDTEYEWRVKRREGVSERWVADLDDEYLNPKPSWEYKGVRPYRGRYWAYSKDNMRQFAREGRLRHTFDGMPEYKRYLDEMPGVPLQDLWTDIPPIIAGTAERLGYPTQKPVALLERIVAASSNEGDVVLDPFCGCGTTIHAAEKLGRRWIGIDVTHLAISLVERRLREAFPGIAYEVVGVPKDFGAAEALTLRDKHEFEKWAITLVPDAQPWRGGRKGPDTGIDGIVYLRTGKTASGRALIEVKGGEKVGVDAVHKLKSVVEREKALVGLLVSLREPSDHARREAAAAGLNELDMGTGTARFPRIQILTIAGLLSGAEHPRLPIVDSTVFKRARREERDKQGELGI